MSELYSQYCAFSATSPRSELSSVLQRIIQAPQNSIDSENRSSLITVLLEDINECAHHPKSNKSRLTYKDASQAILAIKILGHHRQGSELITTPANLSLLLSVSTAFKDYPEASGEALRCIANGLLLVEEARSVWISKEVCGGEASVECLEKSTSPEQIFIASRLLFLSTASSVLAAGFIQGLVEGKIAKQNQNIVDIIGSKLDVLLIGILAGTKFAREAMSELLKFAFNIAIHYPKIVDNSDKDTVMGERWNERLDSFLTPLLHTFNSLPATFPSPLTSPMTQVIHVLLTVPVSQSLLLKWFPRRQNSPSSGSPSSSHSSALGGSPSMIPTSQLPGVSQQDSPSTAKENKEHKPGRVDRALSSMLAAGRRSLSRSNSPLRVAPPHDTMLHAYSLLDVSLAYYCPGDVDPDHSSVREKCKIEGEKTGDTLDDILTPLVALITRLCVGDETSRTRLREWLVPHDIDRTVPLESRRDLLGRCLRLLACVYHRRLKDAIGEMLYAMCDSDAVLLSAQIGYGNVAGFLFNKGVFSPPSQSSTMSAEDIPTTSADGVPIDPITGIAQRPVTVPDMTEEEKEQEAEKLFVLFDRLEKSGSIQPSQNPIRKAVQQGKLG